MIRPITLAAVALLAAPAAAQASPANALQPANVYFGTVQSGDHPTAFVTVKNVTGHNQHEFHGIFPQCLDGRESLVGRDLALLSKRMHLLLSYNTNQR